MSDTPTTDDTVRTIAEGVAGAISAMGGDGDAVLGSPSGSFTLAIVVSGRLYTVSVTIPPSPKAGEEQQAYEFSVKERGETRPVTDDKVVAEVKFKNSSNYSATVTVPPVSILKTLTLKLGDGTV